MQAAPRDRVHHRHVRAGGRRPRAPGRAGAVDPHAPGSRGPRPRPRRGVHVPPAHRGRPRGEGRPGRPGGPARRGPLRGPPLLGPRRVRADLQRDPPRASALRRGTLRPHRARARGPRRRAPRGEPRLLPHGLAARDPAPGGRGPGRDREPHRRGRQERRLRRGQVAQRRDPLRQRQRDPAGLRRRQPPALAGDPLAAGRGLVALQAVLRPAPRAHVPRDAGHHLPRAGRGRRGRERHARPRGGLRPGALRAPDGRAGAHRGRGGHQPLPPLGG